MDATELVLATFGFSSIEQWKADPHLGGKTPEQLAAGLNFKSVKEWHDAVMPLHMENRRRILEALSMLWKSIGKPVNTEQMQIYYRAFANYPPEVVEGAVMDLVKSRKYSSVPALGELMEATK